MQGQHNGEQDYFQYVIDTQMNCNGLCNDFRPEWVCVNGNNEISAIKFSKFSLKLHPM